MVLELIGIKAKTKKKLDKLKKHRHTYDDVVEMLIESHKVIPRIEIGIPELKVEPKPKKKVDKSVGNIFQWLKKKIMFVHLSGGVSKRCCETFYLQKTPPEYSVTLCWGRVFRRYTHVIKNRHILKMAETISLPMQRITITIEGTLFVIGKVLVWLKNASEVLGFKLKVERKWK